MGWPQGWVEWVTALSGLGVAGTIAGLGLSYKQISKTRSAAESASRSANVVTQQLASSRLMLHLSLARQVEQDLQQTRSQNDIAGATRALVRWRIIAPTIRASVSQPPLKAGLTRSVSLARIAEGVLSSESAGSVLKSTQVATDAISEIIDGINEYAETLAASPSVFADLVLDTQEPLAVKHDKSSGKVSAADAMEHDEGSLPRIDEGGQ